MNRHPSWTFSRAAAWGVLASLWLSLGSPACRGLPEVRPDSPPRVATIDPGPGILPWQWQLAGSQLDLSIDGGTFDIDLFETDAEVVGALQARGRQVFCYLSAGSWEKWRPDADRFPAAILGKDYQGWPGEKWLDIRQIDVLGPIMEARLDQCQAKGFDGVEPDNLDGYANRTGFALTYQDQLAYNRWLAAQAHERGLSVGLKNDGDQAADLLDAFDWALVEDCFTEDWCGDFTVFVAAGKPVFAAEYTDRLTVEQFRVEVCPRAAELSFNVILKNRELDAWREVCPQGSLLPFPSE